MAWCTHTFHFGVKEGDQLWSYFPFVPVQESTSTWARGRMEPIVELWELCATSQPPHCHFWPVGSGLSFGNVPVCAPKNVPACAAPMACRAPTWRFTLPKYTVEIF